MIKIRMAYLNLKNPKDDSAVIMIHVHITGYGWIATNLPHLQDQKDE